MEDTTNNCCIVLLFSLQCRQISWRSSLLSAALGLREHIKKSLQMCNIQHLKTFFNCCLVCFHLTILASTHCFASFLRLFLSVDKVIFNQFFKAIGKFLLFFQIVVKEYNFFIWCYCYWISSPVIRENKTLIYFGGESCRIKKMASIRRQVDNCIFPYQCSVLKSMNGYAFISTSEVQNKLFEVVIHYHKKYFFGNFNLLVGSSDAQ